MLSKRKWLRGAKLYLILDTQVNSYVELLDILKKSVGAGIDIVQLRDKHGAARDILEFCAKAKKIINGRIPFVVNDRVDLAMIAGVSGVHLGQKDIPLKVARTMMGDQAMIGVSCQTFEDARRAEREGADYIGFGSVFKTQTKPERPPMDVKLLAKVMSRIKIPVFAIGGIGCEHIGSLRRLGVKRVAICRDICQAADAADTVREIKKSLLETS